ncbi:MAG: hypothetical protein AB1649_20415, partial [Chloroflexota bacterium]
MNSGCENNLHITIGAAVNGKLEITHELRMLKAALLYADRVKVCSLTSSMLVTILPLLNLSEDQALEAIEQWLPLLGKIEIDQITALIQQYKNLKRKKIRTKHELILLGNLKKVLSKFREDIGKVSENLLITAGVEGLLVALQSGLVEFDLLNVNSPDLINDFFEKIKASMLSGTTYPLLDDQTGNLVKAALDAGKFEISNAPLVRAKQVGLSAGLFEKLPLLDNATIDEVIDVRKELEKPLIRFRSAIISFSEEIESATWDKDFPFEVDQVFRSKVEPAMLDIHEAFRANNPIQRLIQSFADKPLLLPGTSALGYMISQASELPAIIGLAAGASVAALDGIRQWREKNTEIERNQ